MISHAAFVGVDHPGRAFLALTIYHRYDGEDDGASTHNLERLLEDGALDRAKLLASMFKLAYILSAAMAGMLPKIKLSVEGKVIILRVPKKFSDLLGERVEKRLASLAAQMGKTGRIEIAK
jgi:exopolyphosphatase / guanosine-5'-triphosphate,3'-diphosphate pyrophosphatase